MSLLLTLSARLRSPRARSALAPRALQGRALGRGRAAQDAPRRGRCRRNGTRGVPLPGALVARGARPGARSQRLRPSGLLPSAGKGPPVLGRGPGGPSRSARSRAAVSPGSRFPESRECAPRSCVARSGRSNPRSVLEPRGGSWRLLLSWERERKGPRGWSRVTWEEGGRQELEVPWK